jgi:hypothetical protein
MRYFTTENSVRDEIPRGATLVVDERQRELIKGETFAFMDSDGDFFICRIENVGKAKRGVVGRDGCEIIGRLVDWVPVRLH